MGQVAWNCPGLVSVKVTSRLGSELNSFMSLDISRAKLLRPGAAVKFKVTVEAFTSMVVMARLLMAGAV